MSELELLYEILSIVLILFSLIFGFKFVLPILVLLMSLEGFIFDLFKSSLFILALF